MRKKVDQFLPDNVKLKAWHFYVLVILVGILPLFYDLGEPVLSIWDESRRAVNSYEMYENGNFLVTHFNGEPEMWGTKPPLLIWMQTASMKIFGVSEWSLRFPSALAGLLLGFLILWFSNYFTRSYLPGFLTVLVLYTSTGYVNLHSVRTADFDSILLLFTTAASFFFFLATEAELKKKKNRFILLFFLMLTLAAMTKGIAAFIMGPAYLVYLLLRKDLRNWLKNPNFYYGIGFLVAVVAGYYLLRESANPGYLQAVLENEVTGRYMETLEQNKRPFSFYFTMLYQHRFQDWYYLIPVGIILVWLSRDIRLRRLMTYLLLLTFTYLLVISIAETKLAWYDLPVYPFISMMVAFFFVMMIRALKRYSVFNSNLAHLLIAPLIVIFFFAAPYYRVYKSISSGEIPKQEEKVHRISHFLRDIIEEEPQMDEDFTVVYQGDFQHFLFYIYQLRDLGYNVNFTEPHELYADSKYIVYQEEVLEELRKKYIISSEEIREGIFEVEVE